ncbi:NUDIX domain-containing protein [Streptomyces sp. NPDC088141]|uniref:NUDIX domain-containing protein n=1 Tax=unclassified Streptomyces TaxID=2593676 RepID=UPI0034308B1D
MSYRPSLWPVSVKGVAMDHRSRVVLLYNERNEWELAGGRLEIGPPAGSNPADRSPEETLERELREETGWEVESRGTAGELATPAFTAACRPSNHSGERR